MLLFFMVVVFSVRGNLKVMRSNIRVYIVFRIYLIFFLMEENNFLWKFGVDVVFVYNVDD